MKLISRSRKGQHAKKVRPASEKNGKANSGNEDKASDGKKKWSFSGLSKKKKIIAIASCVVALMFILGVSTLAVLRWQIEPMYSYLFRPGEADLATLSPGIVIPPSRVPSNDEMPDASEEPVFIDEEVEVEAVERDTNHINFLLLGIDEHGNTDVIMLAAFNTEKSTMEIVSIPRDTMVNVSWNIRKANSIHAYMRNKHRNDSNRDEKIAESTIEHFRDLLGFHADYMVTVTFGGFRRIIDSVGPISFNVPASVNVDGVRVSRGNQRLNGTQALAVMRSRNTYANHAIGRDYAQQEFLKVVATTVINANWSASKVADMVDVFFRHVNSSSIPARYQIGFANDFLRLKSDDISFSMMPGAIDTARGNSYITILVDEWLALINEKFNPFSRDITIHDVSILTRGADRRLMVTDGNWQGSSSWASSSLGVRNPSLTTDSSRPVPGRAPPAQITNDGGDQNPVTEDTGNTDAPGGDD